VQKKVAAYSPEQKANLVKVIAAVSAEAQLKSQLAADQRDTAMIEEGRVLLLNELKCSDYHQFRNKDEDATGPDLTGYGSLKWLINFINNPTHADLYG
jgi:hypothetical protein